MLEPMKKCDQSFSPQTVRDTNYVPHAISIPTYQRKNELAKIARVNIDKTAFFRVSFRDAKVWDYKNLDHRLDHLESNDQPINHQIIDGQSSYKPKLSFHQNRREINVFVDINLDHFRFHLCVDRYLFSTFR